MNVLILAASLYFSIMPEVQKVVEIGGDVDCAILSRIASEERGEITEAPAEVSDQAYRLEIGNGGVKIVYGGVAGERYAKETLNQIRALSNGKKIPAATITDWPSLKWRGVMNDCGRNFLALEGVRAIIDFCAKYKMNLFHWHITDYHGWRLESKKFPALTAKESFTRQIGKFYTQQEFKEMIAYAKARGVTIMPELDVPGHTLALRKGLGVKKMSDPTVGPAVDELIKELCSLASAEEMPFVHLGTDEARIDAEYVANDQCSKWAQTVADCGRKAVRWAPGEPMVVKGGEVIDMCWHDNHITNSTYRAFDSARMYFASCDPFAITRQTHFTSPCRWPVAKERKLGAIACAWHDDAVGDDTMKLFRDVVFFPAIMGFADTYWHGRKDVPEYCSKDAKMPPVGSEAYDMLVRFEARLRSQRDLVLKDFKLPLQILSQTDLRWKLTDATENKVLADGVCGGTVNFAKHGLKNGNIGRAEMMVYSPKAQKVGAWIAMMPFGTAYTRGENSPLPEQGEWNHQGAWVEVNGEKIAPPKWGNPGLKHDGVRDADEKKSYKGAVYSNNVCEVPMANEEVTAREPATVTLKAGWNRIVVVMPGKPRRKVFTFALLKGSSEHPREVEGLNYKSPTRSEYFVDDVGGDDSRDGKSEKTAWRSIERVNVEILLPGDVVKFKRGGLWRGTLVPRSGDQGAPITYTSYGKGEKPIFQRSLDRSKATDWHECSPGEWMTENVPIDIGIFIVNHGEKWGVKKWHEPKWDVPQEPKWMGRVGLKDNLDFYHDAAKKCLVVKYPQNPGEVFKSIELAETRHIIAEGGTHDVVFDSLWLRYGAAHGIGGGNTYNIVVRNCDVCWIGGGLQFWRKRDGTNRYLYPVRYGNGIEFWDNSRNCLVERCRLWEIYDAALTNQGRHSDETEITWRDNVIWNSEYSFEYWNAQMTRNVLFEHNTCVDAGKGWAHAQRPDGNGSHLMYYSNSAATTNFVVRNNIFCRATHWTCRSALDWRYGLKHDHNLVYNDGNVPVIRWLEGRSLSLLGWAKYRELGFDPHSEFAEPRFVNPSIRDYRLRSDSPGLHLASDGTAVGARNMPGLDKDQSLCDGACSLMPLKDSEVLLWPSKDTVIRAQQDSKLTMLPNGVASVVTGVNYPWPGMRMDFANGTRDLSSYSGFRAAISNTTDKPVEVTLHVKSKALQGQSPSGVVKLAPHAVGCLTVNLKPMPWRLDAPLELNGMRGYPNCEGNSKIFDITKTESLHFFRSGSKEPTGFAILGIALAKGEKNSIKTFKASEFLPFVDRLGQFKHDDWPGKVHSDEELKRTRQDEAKWLTENAETTIANADRFGGWAGGPQLKATGFFRTEKVNGKWWLVDPDGHLFFSHGVDCVNHGEGFTGVSYRENYFEWLPKRDDATFGKFFEMRNWKAAHGFYAQSNHYPYAVFNLGAANMVRKYGKDWQNIAKDMAHRRIRAWGLNTIANWSQYDIYSMRRTPYTETFSTGGRVIEGSEGWWGKFRDPFSPEFEQNIRRSAANMAKRTGNDPWCIGWFVDNELAWGDNNTAHGRWILRSPANQPAKIAAIDMLKRKYAKIEDLNAVWKTDYANWQALLDSTKIPDVHLAKQDLEDIHRLSASKYFRTIADAIKTVAPNRLYLGTRIAWGTSVVYEESSKYCDVVSVNIYNRQPNRDLPAGAVDKPMINGEFHFGALDRGMFHTGLVATSSQKERAECYRNFVNACLDHPRMVGTHWFQWKDQPLTGRSDGENYQIGFLTITDTPYPELVEASREIGAKMYSRRYNGNGSQH